MKSTPLACKYYHKRANCQDRDIPTLPPGKSAVAATSGNRYSMNNRSWSCHGSSVLLTDHWRPGKWTGWVDVLLEYW